MRGIAGLSGWQWLFLLEGLFTIVVGLIFIAFFPQSPANPRSLIAGKSFRYFTERESAILQARVFKDDPSKLQPGPATKTNQKQQFTNWRILPHFLTTILGMASAHALGAYAPTLVIGFGYGRLQSNAMMTIGAWILLVLNLLWGWLADKYSKRGLMVFLGVLGLWVFQLGNRLLITSPNRDLRFGFLTMATAFMANWRMLPPHLISSRYH